MAVSMQSPISNYGNFGKVISDTVNNKMQINSNEKMQDERIESQEIMQLRDLHEKAREFDLDLDLRRDIFDVDAQNTLGRLETHMDQYWNYQEDLNSLNLKNAVYERDNNLQIDSEQKLIQNNLIPKVDELKAKINQANTLWQKDRQQTQKVDHAKWYNPLQKVQDLKYNLGLPGVGLSSEELTERNIKSVDAQHIKNLKKIYADQGISTSDMKVSFGGADGQATVMNAPTLKDLLSNKKFAGNELSGLYNNQGLHQATMSGLNQFNQTNIMDAGSSASSLFDLVDTEKYESNTNDINNMYQQQLSNVAINNQLSNNAYATSGNVYQSTVPPQYKTITNDPYKK